MAFNLDLEVWHLQRTLEECVKVRKPFLPMIVSFSQEGPEYGIVAHTDLSADTNTLFNEMFSILSVTDTDHAVFASDSNFVSMDYAIAHRGNIDFREAFMAIQIMRFSRDRTYEHRWYPYMIDRSGTVWWYQLPSLPSIKLAEDLHEIADKWWDVNSIDNFDEKAYTTRLNHHGLHFHKYPKRPKRLSIV